MIQDFTALIEAAQGDKLLKVAVAVAEDHHVLSAVKLMREKNLASGVLVGDVTKIKAIATAIKLDLSQHEIVAADSVSEACQTAVELVVQGKADVLMKGLAPTNQILRAVLKSDLRGPGLLSHVGVFEIPNRENLLILSDSAINITPDLAAKESIIENSLVVAQALGLAAPKLALVCASEEVNEKMPATVDAAELTRLNEVEGRFAPAKVKGPLGLDNAVSVAAAKSKRIEHPVAGRADILITPNLETGNVLNKTLEYFADAKKSGVVMGAQVPIVLTSRASSDLSKLYSVALALLIRKWQKEAE